MFLRNEFLRSGGTEDILAPPRHYKIHHNRFDIVPLVKANAKRNHAPGNSGKHKGKVSARQGMGRSVLGTLRKVLINARRKAQ